MLLAFHRAGHLSRIERLWHFLQAIDRSIRQWLNGLVVRPLHAPTVHQWVCVVNSRKLDHLIGSFSGKRGVE
jgi:hypothetical protein